MKRHAANAVGISANGIYSPRIEGLHIVPEKTSGGRRAVYRLDPGSVPAGAE